MADLPVSEARTTCCEVSMSQGQGFLVAQGTALFGGGSAPNAVLAGPQAERQACGADGTRPADCFGCLDLAQRGAIGRDREKQLGILAAAGAPRHPAEGARVSI